MMGVHTMPIDFPSAKEFFRLFWNGVFGGIREMLAFFFSAVTWLIKTVTAWLS
jgi:hypothetical protein